MILLTILAMPTPGLRRSTRKVATPLGAMYLGSPVDLPNPGVKHWSVVAATNIDVLSYICI